VSLLLLVLHQSASHNFSLSIELTSNRLLYYKTVVDRLDLAQFVSRPTYDLLHSNLDHFLHKNSFTYKFTYLQIGLTNSSTLSYDLVHTNLDNILPTNSLYNVTPTNSSVMMNYQHLTLDICCLVDENNQWSSTIVSTQGDGFLDISSTLMGDFSATPVSATNQLTVYPSGKAASFYRFDPDLYQGEQSWPTLKAMLINAGHVSGCRLTTKYLSLRVSINRKATYQLSCCHGVTVRKMGEFKFNGDDVGQCNVIKEHIKRVKTGRAMSGKCGDSILIVLIRCLILLYEFVPVSHHKFAFQFVVQIVVISCFTLSLFLSHILSFFCINILLLQIGTDAMASNLKKEIL
jgi:hypothetical protein